MLLAIVDAENYIAKLFSEKNTNNNYSHNGT